MIEKGITSIERCAFYDGDDLTSVTVIAHNAFNGCDRLANFAFPASLGTINQAAFANTPRHNTFYYAGTAKQWATLNIDSSNNAKLYGWYTAKTSGSKVTEITKVSNTVTTLYAA